MDVAILNVIFQPTKAIRKEFRLFAGRVKTMDKCLDALAIPGSSMAIYGARGVGKSSLAYQLYQVIGGQTEVAEALGIHGLSLGSPCSVIWHECKSNEEIDIDGLLLHVLRPAVNEHAFSSVFPKIYKDEAFLDHVQTTHGIDLRTLTWQRGPNSGKSVFSPEVRSELKPAGLVGPLFRDVVDYVKIQHDEPDVVLFVDEFDRLDDRSGLATLLKSLRNFRFVFMGVANDLKELITDHESVVRKLIGSSVELPGLNEDEIRTIFKLATRASKNSVQFEDAFVDRVIHHAYGFPWVAQHLGFHACRLAYKEQSEKETLVVEERHFRPAMRIVLEFLQNSHHLQVESFADKTTEKEILSLLCSNAIGFSRDELRGKLADHLKRWASDSVDRLKERGVIAKRDGKYWFADPTRRILYEFYLEQQKDQEKP